MPEPTPEDINIDYRSLCLDALLPELERILADPDDIQLLTLIALLQTLGYRCAKATGQWERRP